jgi:hypothetical protein
MEHKRSAGDPCSPLLLNVLLPPRLVPGMRHNASLASAIGIGQSVKFATVKVMVNSHQESYAALFFEQQD